MNKFKTSFEQSKIQLSSRFWSILRGTVLSGVVFLVLQGFSSALTKEGVEEHKPIMNAVQAAILGVVEGVTEFLPVSSTGHLIIAGELLGLRDLTKLTEDQYEATQAFEIVIQSGAILAVIFIFGKKLREIFLGVFGKSAAGRRLFLNIAVAFVPTAIFGLLLHKFIKAHLQTTLPVVFALAVGGIWMILFEKSKWGKSSREKGVGIDDLTMRMAFFIGLFQCIAMWPGTSRSMMTIMGGMILGLNPVAAAEFSFVLGLPTLLSATALKIYKEGHLLIEHIGVTAIGVGLLAAAISAFIAVKAFVSFLNRRGLTIFGWYRIGLATILWIYFGSNGAL